jgi:hypothetical protein
MSELDLSPDVIDVREPVQELVEQLLIEVDGIIIATTEYVEQQTIEVPTKPKTTVVEIPVQAVPAEVTTANSILDYGTVTRLDHIADIHATLDGPTESPPQTSRSSSAETIPGSTADMAHHYELAA